MIAKLEQGPFRVLIVGCGNIAGRFDLARPRDAPPLTHAGAFAQHPGFRIMACLDPNYSRRRELAQHWNIPCEATSFDELAEEIGSFDVISICSPTALHHEHLDAALKLRPRLIFGEKPLTRSHAESVDRVEACREQGVTLVVNYTRRWDPAVDALVADLHGGKWGAIRSVVAHYNKGVSNNGGHMLDLLLRIVGPLELVATTSSRYDFWPDDPTVAALLRSRNAEVPVYLSPADARDYAFFELELVCQNGIVRMQSGGMHWQARGAVQSEQFEGYRQLGEAQEVEGLYPLAMSRAVSHIHSHLSEGRSVISSGEEALEVQRLCQRILDSTHLPSASPPRL